MARRKFNPAIYQTAATSPVAGQGARMDSTATGQNLNTGQKPTGVSKPHGPAKGKHPHHRGR